MQPSPENLITVGRIIGTHGIRGQLRLHSFSGNLASLNVARTIMLRSPDGLTKEYELRKVAEHGGKMLLTLGGFDNINHVLDLVGHELCLRREQLPEPDEDEYYWHDLLGLDVLLPDGSRLGTLTDIMETAANDIYLVKGSDREYLIPAVASVIAHIDLNSRTMAITPLEGLLDL